MKLPIEPSSISMVSSTLSSRAGVQSCPRSPALRPSRSKASFRYRLVVSYAPCMFRALLAKVQRQDTPTAAVERVSAAGDLALCSRAMMRWISWDGRNEPSRGDSEDGVRPPPEGTLLWLDIEGPDAKTLALLGERFGFHPLALEDCAHLDQRPKLEAFDDHTFLVLQSLNEPTEALVHR